VLAYGGPFMIGLFALLWGVAGARTALLRHRRP